MSRVDVSTEQGETGDESAVGDASKRGRRIASAAARYLRGGAGTGSVAGIGGLLAFRGLRSIRKGHRRRGIAGVLAGGAALALAARRRRSAGDREGETVDQRDVADTSPDIESVAGTAGAESGPEPAGDRAGEVVDTSPDIADVESRPERDRDADSGTVDQTDVVGTGIGEGAVEPTAETDPREDESFDTLGAAAYDEHGRQVPVPQRAFNRNLLALGSEAFWGVREADETVLVSQEFDRINDEDGVRYVGSSEIDEDRMLSIPDVVTNHWNDVAEAGTAVESGHEIAFATTDDLQANGHLLVLPEGLLDEREDES